MGQTEVEILSLEEQELLKEEMLALLGMTYAPDRDVERYNLAALGNKTVRGGRGEEKEGKKHGAVPRNCCFFSTDVFPTLCRDLTS